MPAQLPASATAGVEPLRSLAADDAAIIARSFVDFTINPRPATRRRTRPPHTVVNRRRRAAMLWIQAILSGAVDEDTLRTLTHSWLPQLAGTGPDPQRAVRFGRHYIEYLRGALTAAIVHTPHENLVPEAKAIHALEAVLSIHYGAIRAGLPSRPTGPQKTSSVLLQGGATHL